MSTTVRTLAQLQGLPVGTVVMDRFGLAWQKHDPEGRDPLWHAAKHGTLRYNDHALAERRPLTILHLGPCPAEEHPQPLAEPVRPASARRSYPKVGESIVVQGQLWTVTDVRKGPTGRIEFYEVLDETGHLPNVFTAQELLPA